VVDKEGLKADGGAFGPFLRSFGPEYWLVKEKDLVYSL
jgi:hypothetical protein